MKQTTKQRERDQLLTRRQALARMSGLAAFAFMNAPRWPTIRPRREHPEPRPGITGANVLPVKKLGKKKDVIEAFDAARAHAEIFDGLWCPCDCGQHRSLLACFESDQPTGCLGCREAADVVVEEVGKGRTLDEIRQVFDKKWSFMLKR